eukprot:358668-Chlamydomonas_euryale.AAC.3
MGKESYTDRWQVQADHHHHTWRGVPSTQAQLRRSKRAWEPRMPPSSTRRAAAPLRPRRPSPPMYHYPGAQAGLYPAQGSLAAGAAVPQHHVPHTNGAPLQPPPPQQQQQHAWRGGGPGIGYGADGGGYGVATSGCGCRRVGCELGRGEGKEGEGARTGGGGDQGPLTTTHA